MYENQNKVSKNADKVSNIVNEKIEKMLDGSDPETYQECLNEMFRVFVTSKTFKRFTKNAKDDFTYSYQEINDLLHSLESKTA